MNMEMVMHKDVEYKAMNGTFFFKGTNDDVMRVLERVRLNGQRVHVFYGDTSTGRDWLEENDVTGTVGRSMGPVKSPLLIHNSRSMGGSVILTGDIVRITSGKTELYRHPNYNLPQFVIKPNPDAEYPVGVFADGDDHANFKTEAQAKNWIAFMQGERGAK